MSGMMNLGQRVANMVEKRDMSGILFKNDRKETDKQPDYTGNCTIEGKDYWMSAWIKQGNKGKFMSFAYKPKESPEQRAQVARKHSLADDLDDEIPGWDEK